MSARWSSLARALGVALLVLVPLSALAQARLAAQSSPVVTTLTLFAGDAEGLWRSRDWAGSWERVRARGLERLGAVHAVQALGQRVWLGGVGGLFVSDDFGETWAPRGEFEVVHALVASRYPEADPTLFVGSDRGLFRSSDGGRTFEPTPLQGVAVTRLEWPGPALVIGTRSGLRVSDDGARSFRPASVGLPAGEVRSLALSSYFAIDPVLFAGVGRAGVYRSTDGGATFQSVGLAGTRVDELAWLGPHLYAATSAGLFRSDDAGRTFERRGAGLGELAVGALLFPHALQSAAEFFVGTERGVFRTQDGGLRFEPTGFKGAVTALATFPPPAQLRPLR